MAEPAIDDPTTDPAPPDPAPADPPTDPPAAATILDDPEPKAEPKTEPKADPAAPNFGEGWRQEMAGDDDKLLKQLNRFQTPAALAKAFTDTRAALQSSRKIEPLGDDASEDEIKQWRENNGVPASVDDYEIAYEDGLVLSEEDNEVVKGYLELAHAQNLKAEQVAPLLNHFFKGREQEVADRQLLDNTQREAASEALRDEWGQDYRSNKLVLDNFVQRLPETVRDNFMSSRMADGTALFNDPEFVKFVTGIEREINPTASVIPNSVDSGKTIEGELAEIKKIMHTPDYNEEKRARYLELLTAQEALAQR